MSNMNLGEIKEFLQLISKQKHIRNLAILAVMSSYFHKSCASHCFSLLKHDRGYVFLELEIKHTSGTFSKEDKHDFSQNFVPSYIDIMQYTGEDFGME